MQQIRAKCAERWRIKDLAALLASCPQSYPQKPWRFPKAFSNHRVRAEI
jgi:hypothetical protein